MGNESLANLAVVGMAGLSDFSDADAERVGRYARNFRSRSTYRGWNRWWQIFGCLCSQMRVSLMPMSTQTVVVILARLADAGYAYGTITDARSVISVAHSLHNVPNPTKHRDVKNVLAGIARTIGTEKLNRKEALLMTDLEAIMPLMAAKGTLHALQEWAVLLLGFYGAFRRSEIVALNVEDVRFFKDRMDVTVRRSKTKQSQSQVVHIGAVQDERFCPVKVLKSWIDVLGEDRTGPIFCVVNHLGVLSNERMCDRTVARIVKRFMGRLGLNPDHFGAHSLRAGFITQGVINGIPDLELALHARQSDLRTVICYNRPRGHGRNLSQAML